MKDLIDICDINIPDSTGELRDIEEIIAQLANVHTGFSTHAMSDHALYLQGQKNMLGQVIDYLQYLLPEPIDDKGDMQ